MARVTLDSCTEWPMRRLIYDEIERRPGRTLSYLIRAAKTTSSTIHWHVGKLERAGLVVSETYHGNRIYHATSHGAPGKRMGRAIALIEDPRSKRTLAALQQMEDVATIAKRLRMSEARVLATLDALRLTQAMAPRPQWGLDPGFAVLHNVPGPA